MRDITLFTETVAKAFDNEQANLEEFNGILSDAARGIYEKYSRTDANEMIRELFNKISSTNWKTATPMQKRQDWRLHKDEYFSVIEEVIADRLVSGWGETPFTDQFVDMKNLALGDKNEFYVEDTALMQVSKFAGNHHDIIRQKVGAGKAFSVDTSWYAVKCYADFEQFRSGKIDFTKMVDKMYASIKEYRNGAIYDAFMTIPASFPTDLKLSTAITAATAPDVKALAENVRAITGKDVAIVGTRVVLDKLSATVSYDVWSDSMKDEKNKEGKLGYWEGYTLIETPRVNKINTINDPMTTDAVMLIVPVDPEFKPVKVVNEGDVAFYETGMDGMKKDMTVDAEIAYKEGIAVVINELYGIVEIA